MQEQTGRTHNLRRSPADISDNPEPKQSAGSTISDNETCRQGQDEKRIDMRNEFLFQLERTGHLMNLRELEHEMNEIISEQVQRDFKKMDKMMVEIYDSRQSSPEQNPPLRSLGKIPLDLAIRKFR